MGFFRHIFGKDSDKKDAEEKQAAEQKQAVEKAEEEAKTVEQQVETVTDEDNQETTPAVSLDNAVTAPLPSSATRQLEPETFFSAGDMFMVYGQSSDVGQIRTKNEDSVFSFYAASSSIDDFPNLGLFVVADGMGGHEFGEQASATTVRVVSSEVLKQVYIPLLTGTTLADLPPMMEVLTTVLQQANVEVSANSGKDSGTTCTAAIIVGERGYFAHIGDSRAYIINNTEVEQITRDHSMVQRLVELGQLTPEEAKDHPRNNALYRALGFKDELEVDVFSRRIPPHSKLLLCSDGLWNLVPKEVIHETVLHYPNPQDACHKLVSLANQAGGDDNISVILVNR